MNDERRAHGEDEEWLSVYLFLEAGLYDVQCDQLVVQVIAPMMMEYLRNAWIERFFFIRYGENGPHVRLRLHGNGEALRTLVKPALAQRVAALHGTAHSLRDIRWIAYEPEIERYGGPHALPVAEEFFCQSSDIVCRWLTGLDETNRSRRLGRGLLAMVSLAHAAASDLSMAVTFLNAYGRSYLKRLGNDASVQASWVTAVDGKYAAQSTQLAPFVSQTWMHLEREEEIGGIVGEYANAAHETMRRLRKLHAAGRVYAQNNMMQDWAATAPFIAASLMHMTSNRLGITVAEEAYLSSLAGHALSAVGSARADVA